MKPTIDGVPEPPFGKEARRLPRRFDILARFWPRAAFSVGVGQLAALSASCAAAFASPDLFTRHSDVINATFGFLFTFVVAILSEVFQIGTLVIATAVMFVISSVPKLRSSVSLASFIVATLAAAAAFGATHPGHILKGLT